MTLLTHALLLLLAFAAGIITDMVFFSKGPKGPFE